MDTGSPQTPDLDLDLPGQPNDQADLDIDLDITVAPEPEPEGEPADGAVTEASEEPDETGASSDDPEVGNTLIRPENS